MQVSRSHRVSGEGSPYGGPSSSRLAVWGPLIEQADAAIIMEGAPFAFGCVGCERSNLMVKYLIQRRQIPVVTVEYPENEEQGKLAVAKIRDFLKGLENKTEVQ